MIIPKENPNPSGNASYYQALRRLEADGLIAIVLVNVLTEQRRSTTEWEWNTILGEWVQRSVVRSPSWRRQRAVRLTPLGAAIVQEMREVWEKKDALNP